MESSCMIEVDDQPYFVLTTPANDYIDGFEVKLSDGKTTWQGSVSKDNISEMSTSVDMNQDEYIEQTKDALTGSGNTKYIYNMKLQGNNVNFTWKKSLEDGLKFQLGSVELHQMDKSYSAIVDMFGIVSRQVKDFKSEIAKLQSENTRLSNERSKAVELLDKCVSEKDNMENDLYLKFASVINKKKEKIRQLISQVEDMADVRQQKHSPSAPENEEMSRTPSPNCSDEQDKNDQVESSQITNLFPEEKEENEAITNPKRRRRRGAPKKTPKSKLVLPNVSSLKKTMSNSSEDSSPQLRKRASLKQQPDPDDLMAEMAM